MCSDHKGRVSYREQPFEIPTPTRRTLSTQSSALNRTPNMCSLDPGSCSLVTQACSTHTHTRIQSANTHAHTRTQTSHPRRTQQSLLVPTHLVFFPYYVQMDTQNCAGVVSCFCWRSSTAPMKPPTGRSLFHTSTSQICPFCEVPAAEREALWFF